MVDLGHARFFGCVFEDLRLPRLQAIDASLVGCTLSGRVAVAMFSIGRRRRMQPSSRIELAFMDNDLTKFDCADLEFRGGIELRRNSLRTSDSEMPLHDVPESATRLKMLGLHRGYTETQMRRLHRLVEWCKEIEQKDLFISSSLMKRFSGEERTVLLDLAAMSSSPLQ